MTLLLERSYDVLSDLFNSATSLSLSHNNLERLERSFNSIYPLMLLFDAICSFMNFPGRLPADELEKFRKIVDLFIQV